MKCPKCGDELKPETFEKIEIDRCAGCRGLWFDKDELAQILDRGAGQAADDRGFNEAAARLDGVVGECPRCSVELKPFVGVARLRVDRCPQCEGVFLDQGELTTLQMWRSLQAKHPEE